jgi:large repetitive protein
VARTALLTFLLSMALATSASAATFSNPAAITIVDHADASPYPSDVAVSGLTGPIVDVNVTIKDYSHRFPDDVGVVLVSPNGDAMLLMNGAGDDPNAVDVDLTFDDQAPVQMSDTFAPTTGVYRPTAYYTGDSFAPPGPGLAYCHPGPAGGNACTMGRAFNGTNPNGTWHLFVHDFTAGDDGSIAGGWSLSIETAPVTSIASGPVGLTNQATPTFGFSASKPGSVFACRFDGGTFAPCSGPGNAHTPATPLADGPHTFSVRARDPLGYFDLAPPERSFTLDTAPPETTLALAPAGTVHNADAAFAFFSSEGGSSFDCSLDGAAPAPCTSPVADPGLPDGAHTFSVVATDAAGNADATPATASWTVDTKPTPPPPPPSPPSPPADTRAPLVAITGLTVKRRAASVRFVGFDDVTTAPAFACALDKKPFATCASPVKLTKLKRGKHTVSVRAADAAGNVSAVSKRAFRVRAPKRR